MKINDGLRQNIQRFVALTSAALATMTVVTVGMAGSATAGSGPCPARPVGTTAIEVISQGATYPVVVHVPAGLNPRTKVPLVFDLHGSFSNGTEQLNRSGLVATAEANGFIVAAPTGGVPTDAVGNARWNIPGVTAVPEGSRDETAFLSNVIDAMAEQLCIDAKRVYATGYSGGGRMISFAACQTPGLFSAIAPVAGLRAGMADPLAPEFPSAADCSPTKGTPVISFHGVVDPVNPYLGGGSAYWQYSVPVALQAWANLNRCTSAASEVVNDTVTRINFSGCAKNNVVELYRISNGGHTWPGSSVAFPAELGLVNPLPASDLIWEFFSRH